MRLKEEGELEAKREFFGAGRNESDIRHEMCYTSRWVIKLKYEKEQGKLLQKKSLRVSEAGGQLATVLNG